MTRMAPMFAPRQLCERVSVAAPGSSMLAPPHAARGRPMGEVSMVLLSAAAAGPGTVRELAVRGCVGYDVARYTASRLVSCGALVRANAGRPAVLVQAGPLGRATCDSPFALLERSFWDAEPSAAEGNAP